MTIKEKMLTLTLLFTENMSLRTWEKIGNLDREIELYKKLLKKLNQVNFITYGGNNEKEYSKQVEPIHLLPTKWHKRTISTLFHLILNYYPEILKTDILKTNQIPGSEIAVSLKKIFRKKLIIRCGYLHSYVVKNSSNNEKEIRMAFQLEKMAFTNADVGIVTSSWQRDWVINNHKVHTDKIKIIPNYVLTDIFLPNPQLQKIYDLIFIGRSGKEKNISCLLEALLHMKQKGKNVSLVLVGSCSDDSKIKEEVNRKGLNVIFKGNIPNFDLPHILNQTRAFILPSIYECHPKALLEAMSCGLPCIGSDILGIRDDIHHMDNGYLCQTDYISISEAIENVLSNMALQKNLGNNAREYIIKNYTLNKIVDLELSVIQEILSK